MSISLNSTSKWKARNLPSLLEYVEKTGRLPECLSMSLCGVYRVLYERCAGADRSGSGVQAREGQHLYLLGRPLGAGILLGA